MRSLFKISLAVLALGILVVAGSVQAQDSGMQKPTLQITGVFNAAFGLISYDKFSQSTTTVTTTDKAYSEWITSYEHRIRFIYGTDDLTAKLVLRPRGEYSASNNACGAANSPSNTTAENGQYACSGTNSAGSGATNQTITGGVAGVRQGTAAGSPYLQDIYATVTWKPMKPLAIEFGRFEGIAALDPIAGTYIMANPVMNGPEYWMNWTNIDGISVSYDAGIVTAGLSVSAGCRPRCSTGNYNQVTAGAGNGTNGNAAAPAATAGNATFQNTQTITPWVNGKVGDIGFRASLPMTSGDINYIDPTGGNSSTKTRSESGSGYAIGAAFTGLPGMVIAADLQSFSVGKDSTLCVSSSTNSCKDWARDAIMVKFEFQGFQASMFDQNTDDGKGTPNSKQEDTYYKFHYFFPVGAGTVGPEYTMANLGKRSLTSVTTVAATDGSYKDISNNVIRIVGRIIF